mmetsp:Transcript_42338/g.83817  ORF Transcript_42338/g.83817 Transcript_42338/m.83817 type:complete len:94 (-) Transcript_42338:1112-1393(-)
MSSTTAEGTAGGCRQLTGCRLTAAGCIKSANQYGRDSTSPSSSTFPLPHKDQPATPPTEAVVGGFCVVGAGVTQPAVASAQLEQLGHIRSTAS